jgi:hypothetical protein
MKSLSEEVPKEMEYNTVLQEQALVDLDRHIAQPSIPNTMVAQPEIIHARSQRKEMPVQIRLDDFRPVHVDIA